eukprot:3918167-Amphidinium_carterae.4
MNWHQKNIEGEPTKQISELHSRPEPQTKPKKNCRGGRVQGKFGIAYSLVLECMRCAHRGGLHLLLPNEDRCVFCGRGC